MDLKKGLGATENERDVITRLGQMMTSQYEGRTKQDVFLTLPQIRHILIYLDLLLKYLCKVLDSSAPIKDNRPNP